MFTEDVGRRQKVGLKLNADKCKIQCSHGTRGSGSSTLRAGELIHPVVAPTDGFDLLGTVFALENGAARVEEEDFHCMGQVPSDMAPSEAPQGKFGEAHPFVQRSGRAIVILGRRVVDANGFSEEADPIDAEKYAEKIRWSKASAR